MNRSEIISALNDMSDELEELGVKLDLYIIGGAVIAVKYDPFRVTDDVDSMFNQEEKVFRAADAVARKRGLPADWINSSAFSLMDESWPDGLKPGQMEEAVLLEYSNLTVSSPSSRYLFLLKMLSTRSEKDYTDLGILFPHTGFADFDEALDAMREIKPDYGTFIWPEELESMRRSVSAAQRTAARTTRVARKLSVHKTKDAHTHSRDLCNKWMPRAKRSCSLRTGHKGNCR